MRRLLGPRARTGIIPGIFLLTAALVAVPPAHGSAVAGVAAATSPGTYVNPLRPRIPGDGTVDSCADPTVLRGQRAVDRDYWYLYCTSDPLNDQDVDGSGVPRSHPIPTMRSRDLVHWTYLGDALPQPPSWAAADAHLWAPDVVYSRATHRYYMSFVVTDTADSLRGPSACASDGDSAIGVAVSRHPAGPWRVSDRPLVPPRPDPTMSCSFFWTFDPDVLGNTVGQRSVIYYGSFYGGLQARHVVFGLHGARTVGTATQIAIPNRYEGANVVKRGAWYWLFASATNCCNGPLTSYGVFAGRSASPMGPFVDKDGQSLLAGRVGGTPVLLPNGNKWVGTGHNSVFRDAAGRWWTIYHAVDRAHPYFDFAPGLTKRPAMLDPLDWVNGWPTVRAGNWASAQRMPAPATTPGKPSAYRPNPPAPLRLGAELPAFSDDFTAGLEPAWGWTGPQPDPSTYGVQGGNLRWDTQAGDIARITDSNDAGVLTRAAPRRGDYVVQTRVKLNLPPEGDGHNFVQAGLVLIKGLDHFVKLVHVSIYETRQTEFAKEVPLGQALDETHMYGNGVVGPPGDLTTLRIVVDRRNGPDHFTAYTRQAGGSWVRGGTWTSDLGASPKIGLVSMGGTGYTARFLDVTTWRLAR